MSIPAKNNFTIYQGSTFEEVIRWEDSILEYKTITGITKSAPVAITSTAHEIPEGWRVKITDVVGMKEINSATNYLIATVQDVNTITINSINSVSYSTYTSGGIITFAKPVDLTGYTARMQIREKIDSATVIHELTTENSGIVINNTNKTITLVIPSTTTANFTFTSAVYSLEMIDSLGKVKTISTGGVSLKKEVTR
jgi:hypothetical protein